jgi:hypothetical protein
MNGQPDEERAASVALFHDGMDGETDDHYIQSGITVGAAESPCELIDETVLRDYRCLGSGLASGWRAPKPVQCWCSQRSA